MREGVLDGARSRPPRQGAPERVGPLTAGNAARRGAVLLVSTSRVTLGSIAAELERAGFAVEPARTLADAERAAAREWSLVVLEAPFGGDDPLTGLVVRFRAALGRPPIVVVEKCDSASRVRALCRYGAALQLEPHQITQLPAEAVRLVDEHGDLRPRVDAVLASLKLTQREDEIARLVLKGFKSTEVARFCGISHKTIRQHISQVYAKAKVTARAELFHLVFPC